MASKVATPPLLLVGWAPRMGALQESLSLSERISAACAQALLWIKSLFSDEAAEMRKAYKKERAFSQIEVEHPGPIHSFLLAMRRAIIHLAHPRESDAIIKYLLCLDWCSEREIERIDAVHAPFLLKKSQNIDPCLVKQLHDQILAFRQALHAHCTHLSLTLKGTANDETYLESKRALNTSLDALLNHFKNTI